MIIKDPIRFKSKITMGVLSLIFLGLTLQNILNQGTINLTLVYFLMTLLTGIGATYSSTVKISKRSGLLTITRKCFGLDIYKSEYKTNSFQAVVLMSTLNLDSHKIVYELFLVGDTAFELWKAKYEKLKVTNSYSKSSSDDRGLRIKCNIEYSDLAEASTLGEKLSEKFGMQFFNFTRK